jgi:hypothetical protein
MEWLRLLLYPEGADGAGGAASGAADNGSGGAAPVTQTGDGTGTEGDEGAESTDEGAEGAEGTEGEGEGEGEGGEGEGLETSPEDGRLIPSYIRKMKESDPVAFKAAKAEFFDLRSRRAIHATTEAAQNDRDTVESLGGSEGIQAMQSDVDTFRELTQQFAKGDPAFAKDMFEEDPIAASLHMQPMLDQMREKDVQGYQGLMARLWQGEFTSTGLPNALKQLKAAVDGGNKEQAAGLLNAIMEWQQSISDFASRAEDPRVRSLLAERAKSVDGKDKEAQATFMQSYQTEAINTVVTDAAKTFDAFFRNRKLDKGDRDDLLRECLASVDRTLKTDKGYHEQLDRHLGRRDSVSALKLVKSRYSAAFPEAVKKVLRRYGMLSGKPGAKPAVVKKSDGQGGAGKAPAGSAGFARVNARPRAEEIDRGRTSNSDIINHRATLKDGKKVDWGHLVKK